VLCLRPRVDPAMRPGDSLEGTDPAIVSVVGAVPLLDWSKKLKYMPDEISGDTFRAHAIWKMQYPVGSCCAIVPDQSYRESKTFRDREQGA